MAINELMNDIKTTIQRLKNQYEYSERLGYQECAEYEKNIHEWLCSHMWNELKFCKSKAEAAVTNGEKEIRTSAGAKLPLDTEILVTDGKGRTWVDVLSYGYFYGESYPTFFWKNTKHLEDVVAWKNFYSYEEDYSWT